MHKSKNRCPVCSGRRWFHASILLKANWRKLWEPYIDIDNIGFHVVDKEYNARTCIVDGAYYNADTWRGKIMVPRTKCKSGALDVCQQCETCVTSHIHRKG